MDWKTKSGMMECWNTGTMEENHPFVVLIHHSKIPFSQYSISEGETYGFREKFGKGKRKGEEGQVICP
jgi:hypothetical protein